MESKVSRKDAGFAVCRFVIIKGLIINALENSLYPLFIPFNERIFRIVCLLYLRNFQEMDNRFAISIDYVLDA